MKTNQQQVIIGTSSLPVAPIAIQVTDEEREEIANAAESLLQRYGGIESNDFRRRLPYLAGKHLPERLYHELALFRSSFGRADYGALVVRNFIRIDQERLGPTPTRWQEVVGEKTGQHEFSAALIHGALGGTLAEFLYQRGGGLSHSLIPDPSMRETQTGAGEVKLGLHTEDANLRNSADFISFLWLRNNEKVPCHLFSLRSLDWEDRGYEEVLRESIFICPADGNHDPEQDHEDVPISVLYGNPVRPWMRVDFPEQLAPSTGQSQRARQALEAFMKDVTTWTYSDFVPSGGDLCVLNNKVCAHGRGSFQQGIGPRGAAVEKRWMLRMMSVVDRFAFYESARPENPHFSEELPL